LILLDLVEKATTRSGIPEVFIDPGIVLTKF
jgi:hypothetical protein